LFRSFPFFPLFFILHSSFYDSSFLTYNVSWKLKKLEKGDK